MQKLGNKIKDVSLEGFTLLEMLLVLLIISVLMLLFIPNLNKQKDMVTDKGKAAVVKIVDNQAELYELNQGASPKLSELENKGDISKEQAKAYRDYYVKHDNKNRKVQD
ncbi:competence type IV pilus major pilin ComGC [Streptococcus porcinus]|uniref:Competence protein n=2 Tax=Streptococcus porcinus TaxID=1340 RepID=A0A4V0H0X2_STRPO|nr:competence type IV pilus major pilin ComGC [Streptococcus porcinus]EGJ26692.1 ComG operon protein 3 family protein [Streptococcus porcinus str. Jelinkova 176]MBA2795688.1 prepilin-type N-terminal cleavage/methylation domain-containing protein [Streptococcus porcinus]SQG42404.1 competence protein [Streptococcus porcinus]VTS15765.1 competence protein [Streptococcus porcinus]VTT41478.1 competence protein [Streptococcus porcinus]